MPRTGPEAEAGVVAVDELGAVLGVEARVVAEYVELGLVRPALRARQPSLTVTEVARLSRALRLARELELHAAAASVLVELLEERDDLRRRLACLEQLSGRGA
jgi:chaperone modulatory protein CbpM